MPLQKNQILTLRIERLSSDGSGVVGFCSGRLSPLRISSGWIRLSCGAGATG